MNYTDKGKNVWATHETIEIINCFLNAPLMLLSITGNSLALAAILRTLYSDILVGVIVQPLLIAGTLKSLTTQDPLLNSVSAMTGFFVVGVSLATMTAISVDRFVALHCHLRYATIVTERRAMFTVGIIWLIMFLSLGLYLWNKLLYHLISSIFTGTCLIICTFSYIGIYRIVRKHQLQIHAEQTAVENSNTALESSNTSAGNSNVGKKCCGWRAVLWAPSYFTFVRFYVIFQTLFLWLCLERRTHIAKQNGTLQRL